MRFDEGALSKGAGASGGDVEHLDNRRDVFGNCEGCGHGFRGIFDQRIGSVDVQIKDVFHVSRNAATCEPRNIRQRILQPREVV